jgi:hypothetical protein
MRIVIDEQGAGFGDLCQSFILDGVKPPLT